MRSNWILMSELILFVGAVACHDWRDRPDSGWQAKITLMLIALSYQTGSKAVRRRLGSGQVLTLARTK
jgi:hypothetical protein